MNTPFLIEPPVREQDRYGDGSFNAPRGDRPHDAIDFACYPGSVIRAVRGGKVTNIGFSYASGVGAWDSPEPYRYVEITDPYGFSVQYHYVNPEVEEGETVRPGDVLGVSQELGRRYPGITEHVHFTVERDGKTWHPFDYLNIAEANNA